GSGEQTQRIDLKKYGYTSDDKIQGFHFINSDSLLIYTYKESEISLLSLSKGKIWAKSLFGGRGPKAEWVKPVVSQANPMVYDAAGQKVYFIGFFGGEMPLKSLDARQRIMVSYDMTSTRFETGINYPEFYWGKNWGGSGGYRVPFYTFLPDSREFLISFIADHTLAKVSGDLEVAQQVQAHSGQFDTISSIPSSSWLFDYTSSHARHDFYLQHPAYGPVYYDQANKHVIRMTKMPQKVEGQMDYTMIALNKSLEIVSEYPFPGELKAFRPLSLPNGLWFVNDAASDPNHLVFSQLK
ncbi:MAG: hypothetical protein AAFQ98_26765, partial [Bacteroidota bacterium]